MSLGTQTWAPDRARLRGEHPLARRARSVRRPLGRRGRGRRPDAVGKALVDRVVAAAGKKIKVARRRRAQRRRRRLRRWLAATTARTILELGQGSRSWVVYRALRELGVEGRRSPSPRPSPSASSPTFPPHVGRFRHPLVVAHLGARRAATCGSTPTSRARPCPPAASAPSCAAAPPCSTAAPWSPSRASSGESGDEVDVRLALDDKGDARGTFTVLLHGRRRAGARRGLRDGGRHRAPRDAPRRRARLAPLGRRGRRVSVSSSEGSWEVALRAVIAIHGFGRPEGKDGKTWVLAGLEPVHVVFPRGPVGTLGGDATPRAARGRTRSPSRCRSSTTCTARIELPAGRDAWRAPPAAREVQRPQHRGPPQRSTAAATRPRRGLRAQPAHRHRGRRPLPGLRREGAGHRRRLHGRDARGPGEA